MKDDFSYRGYDTHNRSHRRVDGEKRKNSNLFGIICMILLLVCSVLLGIRLVGLEMLPLKYLLAAMGVLLVLNVGNIIVQLPRRKNRIGQIICAVVSLILSAVMIYGLVAAGSLQSALEKISAGEKQIEYVDVIVLQGDSAKEMADTKGYKFGVLNNMDTDDLAEVKSQMGETIGTVMTSPYPALTSLADALYAGDVRAIVVSDALLSTLSDLTDYASFSEKTRILHQYELVKELTSSGDTGNYSEEPFFVYCSGTDARLNESTTVCRSDVNIIAAVNPKSHQILLLNTPRDYYVELPTEDNELDKLTHAGLYGIDSSMAALSNLYNIKLSDYVRVNFTGFEAIVDALGGISVWSDYDFTTVGMGLDDDDLSSFKSFTFQKGYNDVNGEEALGFARERYAFEDGDMQRGKNQMAVIRAILDKATSPSILAKYQSVLNAVTSSVTTNISYNTISALVQLQLRDNIQWNITTYNVTGAGAMKPCYSLPGMDLSVDIPDETTITAAKGLLKQVMNGEVPDPGKFATTADTSSTTGETNSTAS